MEEEKIIQLANELLVPLFPGASPVSVIDVGSGTDLVTYQKGTTRIKFKLHSQDTRAFVIQRRQMFPNQNTGTVNEFKIIKAFVSVTNELSSMLETYGNQIQDLFSVRLISTTIANGDASTLTTLNTIINQLDRWSRGTYEGRQHSAAIVIKPTKEHSGIKAENVLDKPFCAVLSNGYDTAITCSKDGFIIGHEVIPQEYSSGAFAPYRHIPIAHWSEAGTISLVLNRKGEILIFVDKQLCFTRRCGQWHYLTHRPNIMQIRYPNKPKIIRNCIYETCLDASFAGTGACIGVILNAKKSLLNDILASDADRLLTNSTDKSRVINSIIRGKNFSEIHRLARMELAAIDGAVLLDEDGNVISVGTILKITSGSDAGGRLAAALALAQFGVGIKISQDGSIRGFCSDSTPVEPALALM